MHHTCTPWSTERIGEHGAMGHGVRGDAAFCSEDCRDEQKDMDEALHAAARRHRLLRSPSASSSSQAAAEAAASTRPPPVMRRRPTIANLAARNPPVAAS
uniref:FLZ-type domain-containing protein n=1 Tax=Zea mays TaxID=4577 RepID=A0A804PTF3_MAIZE